MRYYSVKYKSGRSHPGTQEFWKITIDSKHEGDLGLLEHEKLHVQNWYAVTILCLLIVGALAYWVAPIIGWLAVLAPFAKKALYRTQWFRVWEELRSYKAQLKVGVGPGRPYGSNEFAIAAMIGHGMDEDDARKALG